MQNFQDMHDSDFAEALELTTQPMDGADPSVLNMLSGERKIWSKAFKLKLELASARGWSQGIHTYCEPGLSQAVFHKEDEAGNYLKVIG